MSVHFWPSKPILRINVLATININIKVLREEIPAT
jgi:hypothetical protein